MTVNTKTLRLLSFLLVSGVRAVFFHPTNGAVTHFAHTQTTALEQAHKAREQMTNLKVNYEKRAQDLQQQLNLANLKLNSAATPDQLKVSIGRFSASVWPFRIRFFSEQPTVSLVLF